ncbi:hypothetical protein EDC01DRAFT_634178 [Geopyxis carbonaria]|nr:hypothetical protein EDC01DRAFT_634178 [Geopyxis carbonaria]
MDPEQRERLIETVKRFYRHEPDAVKKLVCTADYDLKKFVGAYSSFRYVWSNNQAGESPPRSDTAKSKSGPDAGRDNITNEASPMFGSSSNDTAAKSVSGDTHDFKNQLPTPRTTPDIPHFVDPRPAWNQQPISRINPDVPESVYPRSTWNQLPTPRSTPDIPQSVDPRGVWGPPPTIQNSSAIPQAGAFRIPSGLPSIDQNAPPVDRRFDWGPPSTNENTAARFQSNDARNTTGHRTTMGTDFVSPGVPRKRLSDGHLYALKAQLDAEDESELPKWR